MAPTDRGDADRDSAGEPDAPGEPLRLRTYEQRRGAPGGGLWFVEAAGDLDLETVDRLEPALERAFRDAIAAGGDGGALPVLAVDLRAVAFVDTAGLGLLVRLRREYAGRCELALVAAEGGHPERALRLTRLERFFRVVRAPEELDA